MSAGAMGWQEEHELDHRRRLRNGALVSLAVHGLFFAILAVSPSREVPPLVEVLSVDLIAPSIAVSRPKPSPAPRAVSKPAPKPAPPAPKAEPLPPPPPPPIAKAPVQALPENVPKKIRKVEPRPRVDPRRRPKEKELSFEDAMAALEDDIGPTETSDLLEPAADPEPAAEELSSNTPSSKGVVVSKEMLAWVRATERKVQSNWKGVSTYKGRGLTTTLEFDITIRGEVKGEPRVAKSSGDPFFDDNAVRAIIMNSPLPAPPRAGSIRFNFVSDED